MIWLNFTYLTVVVVSSWLVGLLMIYLSSGKHLLRLTGEGMLLLGILAMFGFTIALWVELQRPPLRTLGETRLWYSLLLPMVGFVAYKRWRYKWLLLYSLLLAVVFIVINNLHPETYDRSLMPALQSPWFVPHVIVYMLAYALLAASSLVAIKALLLLWRGSEAAVKPSALSGDNLLANYLQHADNMVYMGFALLTLGLIFGALWAKTAWGHYWTWDPKETWAFISWMSYLLYIHLRHYRPKQLRTHLWVLALAFVLLLICWLGVNYLATSANSVHTYTS